MRRPDGGRRRDRARRVRVASATLLVVLVGGAVALRAAGAPIDPRSQPLVLGGASGGSDPRLLAIGDLAPLADGSTASIYYYAYAPDAEYRTGLTLTNAGSAPLTVTGVEPSDLASVRAVELRLPAGALTADLPAPYPSGDARWASEPFHPFTIAPGGEAGVVVAVKISACVQASARPTLAPGASLMPATDPSLASGFIALSNLRLRYEALGIARTADVELFDPIEVVFDEPPGVFVNGCGGG